jgi:hypothetical protein
LEGVKAENDTWFPITDSPENYGYDREREIQVRGTAVWGYDGFGVTYCDFKVSHWRPVYNGEED